MLRGIRRYAFVALAVALGCGQLAGEGKISSESHFLQQCSASSECPEPWECVCGRCSPACTSDSACASVSSLAVCVSADELSCADASGPSACDVRCTDTASCAPLGLNHECQAGFCRRTASLTASLTDPEPNGPATATECAEGSEWCELLSSCEPGVVACTGVASSSWRVCGRQDNLCLLTNASETEQVGGAMGEPRLSCRIPPEVACEAIAAGALPSSLISETSAYCSWVISDSACPSL